MWSVPLVVWRGSGQLHQQVTGGLGLPHSPTQLHLTCGWDVEGRRGRREGRRWEREGKREEKRREVRREGKREEGEREGERERK